MITLADVVVTLKLMPDSPERNLEHLKAAVEKVLVKHGRIYKKGVQPIAFGLNALVYSVVMKEQEGGTEPIEADLKKVEGIADVQVSDVTRLMDVRDL